MIPLRVAEPGRFRDPLPGRVEIGPRISVRAGAQGVIVWDRSIGGVLYTFSLVREGWWGVGATGTVRVKRRIWWDLALVHEFVPATIPPSG